MYVAPFKLEGKMRRHDIADIFKLSFPSLSHYEMTQGTPGLIYRSIDERGGYFPMLIRKKGGLSAVIKSRSLQLTVRYVALL